MATLKWFKSGGNYFYFKDAPVHASSITLNKSSIGLTTAGQSTQLVATISPDDAVEKKIHWSSSNITIAIVDQTGLVTCVTPGSCTITAECDGVSATCSVDNSFGFVEYLLVGGGGGGSSTGGGGGGGGAVLYGSLGIKNNTTSIIIGSGGGYGTAGGSSCIGTIIAKGGCSGQGGTGGTSGSGCSGGTGVSRGGGGGGGASSNGTNGHDYDNGGTGGAGICGYGGGGGGGSCSRPGYGQDGGGRGGSGKRSCNATNCGGGGGGGGLGNGWYVGCNGAGGIAIICYKTDGSCGINCATGGTVTTDGDYTVHTFTTNGTFCIIS